MTSGSSQPASTRVIRALERLADSIEAHAGGGGVAVSLTTPEAQVVQSVMAECRGMSREDGAAHLRQAAAQMRGQASDG